MRLDQIDEKCGKLLLKTESLENSLVNLQRTYSLKLADIKTKFDQQILSLGEALDKEIGKLQREFSSIDKTTKEVESGFDSFKARLEREAKAEVKQLQLKIKELEKQIQEQQKFIDENFEEVLEEECVDERYVRAQTLAMWEKIVWLITCWADTNEIASDFETVSLAFLVPSIFNRIAYFEEDYLMREPPPETTAEVIKQGREFIAFLRTQYKTHLSVSTIWGETSELIKMWWVETGAPLILGKSDPRWVDDPMLTKVETDNWEKDPLFQMKKFPKCHDALYSIGDYEGLTLCTGELANSLETYKFKPPY